MGGSGDVVLMFLVAVQELKYEKISPLMDAADFNTSKQFNFVILPSTEYFTRYDIFTTMVFKKWEKSLKEKIFF
jgi:hypothetical protein